MGNAKTIIIDIPHTLHQEKTLPRRGPLVALVASAGLDNTTPLPSPSCPVLCISVLGLPADAQLAVCELGFLPLLY